ncbi:MAG: hypothetical protein IJ677_02090 [Alphaproteobacteria bacterium]|nr:hypothetical protein [Alphaproteobacteria bacterium]
MKRTITMLVMLVVVVFASAQRIAEQRYENGQAVLYLENGQRILAGSLPRANYRAGETIESSIVRTAYERAVAEAAKYRVDVPCGYYGGYYGGYIPYGGSGHTFSIGNSHWGISSSSSNYGGYKTKSTGIRIGSFHIGTSSAGYSRADSSASYEAQKKADAQKATARYSAMRANGVVKNGSTTTNTSSNSTTTAPTGMWMY